MKGLKLVIVMLSIFLLLLVTVLFMNLNQKNYGSKLLTETYNKENEQENTLEREEKTDKERPGNYQNSDLEKELLINKNKENQDSAAPAMDVTRELGEGNMDEYFTQIKITDDIYSRIYKKSYKENCPLPLEDLRYLKLLYYGFDNEVHVGEMIVNKSIAGDVVQIFRELYEVKYQIEKIQLVDDYNADDNESMAANNTSAFNFRYIDGTTTYSNHAKGLALDINPLYNPYVRTRNGVREVLPVSGEEYADRSLENRYYIKKDDLCYQIFTKYGFTWGGEWEKSKDYQHFERKVK